MRIICCGDFRVDVVVTVSAIFEHVIIALQHVKCLFDLKSPPSSLTYSAQWPRQLHGSGGERRSVHKVALFARNIGISFAVSSMRPIAIVIDIPKTLVEIPLPGVAESEK